MEYAITIKHPAKIVNVYIQQDQLLIAGKIAPPVFRYDEEKSSHAKTGIFKGITAGNLSSTESGRECGNRSLCYRCELSAHKR
jgi:hypothetical protein